MNDSNAAVPASAYKTVTLTNLAGRDQADRHVRGQPQHRTSPRRPTRTYNYQRNDDRFEQVEAYYQLTAAQKYIQSLGFTDVNNEAQDVFTDTIRDDNSFYDPGDGHASPTGRRCGRRRGRRGRLARVRPRDPGRPGARVRVERAGRRDRRGLRRLLGGHDEPAGAARASTCRASWTGTRRRTRRPCRTACGARTPARPPPTSTARCMTTGDLVATRCGTSTWRWAAPRTDRIVAGGAVLATAPNTVVRAGRDRSRSAPPGRCTAAASRPRSRRRSWRARILAVGRSSQHALGPWTASRSGPCRLAACCSVGLTGGIGSGKSTVARGAWPSSAPSSSTPTCSRARWSSRGTPGLDAPSSRRSGRGCGRGRRARPAGRWRAAVFADPEPARGAQRDRPPARPGPGRRVHRAAPRRTPSSCRTCPCWSRPGWPASFDLVVVVDAPDDVRVGPAGQPSGRCRPRTPGPGWRPRPPPDERLEAADFVLDNSGTTRRTARAGGRAVGRPAAGVGGLSVPPLTVEPCGRPPTSSAAVAPFEVVSDFTPAGDQPAAIADLTARIRGGGAGRRAARRHRHRQVGDHGLAGRAGAAPDPGDGAQQDPGRPAGQRVPRAAAATTPSSTSSRYYDYYQPEAYVPQTDTYIEKDSSINDEVERLRHSATNSLLTRRDVIVVASVSCIYGLGTPQEYVDRMVRLAGRRRDRARRPAPPVRPDAVHPQRPGLHPRHLPGARRHRRDHPGVRGARRPDRVLRRRDRARSTRCTRSPARSSARSRRCTSSRPRTTSPARSGWSGRSRGIEAELEERLAELERQGKLLEAQRLRMRTTYDIEMMRQVGSCSGIENYSPAHRRPRRRARRRTACSTTSPRTSCSSSTSRT